MGSVTISKGTFPPGAVLTISNPKKDPKLPDDDDGEGSGNDCSKKGEKVTRQSSAVDISVSNAKSKGFKKPVKISLAQEEKEKKGRACLASTNDPEKTPLRCIDKGKKADRGKKSGKGDFIEGETTHFTTFAFLLFSNGENDCNGWIWPTSVGLVGGAIVLSLLITIVLSMERFRPFIAGFNANNAISQVMKKVNSQASFSRSSVLVTPV